MVINRFVGILAVVAIVVTIAALVALATRRIPAWARDGALPLATAIALVTTIGSLYYSDVAGYPPCDLCWYQRIAIYPQVVILAVAAIRRDVHAWATVVPLAVIGSALSLWHVVLERNPQLAGPCDPSNPCAIKWVEEFGFLTIPTMALVAQVALITLTLLVRAAGTPAGERAGLPAR